MSDDMRYLQFLKTVVIQDINSLLEKEKTYQGSWKKSGGISAWMMIVRKLDRLSVLMKATPIPTDEQIKNAGILQCKQWLYDIAENGDVFKKITREETASGGVGRDGSIIAELRDLRRYTILVEAFLIEQGILKVNVFDIDESNHAKHDEGVTIDTGGNVWFYTKEQLAEINKQDGVL